MVGSLMLISSSEVFSQPTQHPFIAPTMCQIESALVPSSVPVARLRRRTDGGSLSFVEFRTHWKEMHYPTYQEHQEEKTEILPERRRWLRTFACESMALKV